MKVSLLCESKQHYGGGFSFLRNLASGLGNEGIAVVDDWQDADICFVSGATMVTKELVESVKAAKKKIVLRVDNIARNSRNRNSGTSRLYKFAHLADAVVYQSDWARDYIRPFLGIDGRVILNSVDEKVFSQDGDLFDFDQPSDVYLYSRFNRDETKMWEVAWYEYQMIQRENPHAQLVIVGNFSDEIRDCNFDFYNQERYRYIGIIETPELMASVYRGCNSLLMTYYNDACSNTLIESMMCGCMPVFRGLGYTGGSQQIVNTYATKGRSFFSLKRMTRDYIKLFESL